MPRSHQAGKSNSYVVWLVGKKIEERAELEGSTGSRYGEAVVLDSLEVCAESYGMNTAGQENIIASLIRVPSPPLWRLCSQAAGKIREPRDMNLSNCVPRSESQRGVCRERVHRCSAQWRSAERPVETEAHGIQETGAEKMVLLKSDDLPPRPGAYYLGIELVILRQRGIVKHVSAKELILGREIMIQSDGEIILF